MIDYIDLSQCLSLIKDKEFEIVNLDLLIHCYKEGLYSCRDKRRLIGKEIICSPFIRCNVKCPYAIEDKIEEYLR